MAADKIIAIHSRLDRCIQYACNPAKVTHCGHALVSGINCQSESAYAEMHATKERWSKTGGVLGYHLIHSYAPGEVTPEQAHELGTELAQRLLGERYEAIVATHSDRAHLHCHIVFNSVSFADGRKYQNKLRDYFGDIREASNAVSRENGLSVIKPKGNGKHYAEWNAERQGKPTVRGLIRQDMDAALVSAVTPGSFFTLLEKQGYTVKRGPNIAHTAVRPSGGSRFIRLDSLGADYSEAALLRRIRGEAIMQAPAPLPHSLYKLRRGRLDRPRRLHGFCALYVRYLYRLGMRPTKRRKSVPFSVRAECTKLERYKRQFRLLHRYRIETTAELSMLSDALQADMDALIAQRTELYRRKQRGEDVTAEIAAITQALRPLRRDLRLCGQIAESAAHIRTQCSLKPEPKQTQIKTKTRRNDKWR